MCGRRGCAGVQPASLRRERRGAGGAGCGCAASAALRSAGDAPRCSRRPRSARLPRGRPSLWLRAGAPAPPPPRVSRQDLLPSGGSGSGGGLRARTSRGHCRLLAKCGVLWGWRPGGGVREGAQRLQFVCSLTLMMLPYKTAHLHIAGDNYSVRVERAVGVLLAWSLCQ